jgi:hypothetical protein
MKQKLCKVEEDFAESSSKDEEYDISNDEFMATKSLYRLKICYFVLLCSLNPTL